MLRSSICNSDSIDKLEHFTKKLFNEIADYLQGNNENVKQIIVSNRNKSKTSSSINKTNNSFKMKEELLKIMKNTFIQEKINNETNLYKLFNKEFYKIIEPYIDEKLNEISTLEEFRKIKISNPFCTEDVNAEFLLENILKNKKQVLDTLHKRKSNNFKNYVINNFDYEDNFNLIQMLRSSIMIYQSILNELNVNINENNENHLSNDNKNILENNNQVFTGIELINNLIKKHNKSKSNIIFIKKIKFLIEKKNNLNFGNKDYDKKKQFIEKIINNLLLNLK